MHVAQDMKCWIAFVDMMCLGLRAALKEQLYICVCGAATLQLLHLFFKALQYKFDQIREIPIATENLLVCVRTAFWCLLVQICFFVMVETTNKSNRRCLELAELDNVAVGYVGDRHATAAFRPQGVPCHVDLLVRPQHAHAYDATACAFHVHLLHECHVVFHKFPFDSETELGCVWKSLDLTSRFLHVVKHGNNLDEHMQNISS